MASSEQGITFGRFDDLSPEEHERIYNILHGHRGESGSKVEFPWPVEEEEVSGAVGGAVFQKNWADDDTIEFGFQDTGFQGNTNEAQQFSFMSGDSQVSQPVVFANADINHPVSANTGQYPGQFMGSGTGQFPSSDNNQFMAKSLEPGIDRNEYEDYSQTDNQGDPDLYDDRSSSKLQASLKPYERRNKKKRPPGYYKQPDTSGPEQDPSKYPPMQPDLTQPPPNFHQEIHYNIPPPGLALNQYAVNNQFVDSNIPNPAHVANFHAGIPLGYQGASDVGNVIVKNVPNNQRQETGDLYEVVIDSVPLQNSANIPARPETYQIQDHERTSSQNSLDLTNQTSANIHEYHPNTNNAIANQTSNTNLVNTGVSKPTRVDVSIKDAPVLEETSQMQSNDTQMSEPIQVMVNNTVVGAGNVESEVKMTEDTAESIPMDTSRTEPDSKEMKGELGTANQEASWVQESVVAQQDAVTVKQEPIKSKPTSWAGLFKSNSATTNTNIVVSEVPLKSSMGDNSSVSAESDRRSEKELSPLPVPACEDSAAKDLGEHLSKMTISHATVSLQPRGLVNRANWCYINGTLQALVACPPFYNLLKKLPRYPALSRGPSSTPILDAMVEFVQEFQPMSRNIDKSHKGVRDISPGVPFEPSNVYKMLQAIAVNPHFKLGKQEDAEEFLSCILDGMHEEMSAAVNLNSNNIESHETVDLEDGYMNGYVHAEGDDMEGEPEDNWEQVGPKKKSVLTRRANFAKTPIADIFAGMVRSAVYKSTAKETATLEPFFTLKLDIQSEKVWTVKDALEGLVTKEPVSGYTCSKTNSEVEVIKKLSLEELPPVLILHLKCFVYNKDGGSQKVMKKVDFGIELEITKDLLSPSARNKLTLQQRSYKLFAVVYHHGKKSTGGHYTTNVFHPGINGWVNSDDSQVKTVPAASVLKYQMSRVPYLLYYRRLDSH